MDLNTKHIKDTLRQLLRIVKDFEEQICEAVFLDLNRNPMETHVSELVVIKEELKLFLKNINSWSKPQNVATPMQLQPGRSMIQREAYGKVLVVAPWNFLFHLSLVPAIGALAAGNKVIIKASPHAPHASRLLAKMVNEALNSELLKVVEGDAGKVEEIISEGVDFIFFTGSAKHGKQVYKFAAEKMLPVVMELGGQNPLIFHQDGHMGAMKRIVWGKLLNAGQTCLSPNHIFVHESQKDAFISAFKKCTEDFYGEDVLGSRDYPKIVNKGNFERLVALTEKHRAHLVSGGKADAATLKVEPAIFEIPFGEAQNCELLQEEIFGPLLPVVTYKDIEEIVKLLKHFESPLAVYLYTSSKKIIDLVAARITSGSLCVNDCLVQGANPHFPFGGIHQSGIGQYHGYHSYLAFSHPKSILIRSKKFSIIPRFPPYAKKIFKIFKYI